MERLAYPTRQGVPVSTLELFSFEDSILNLEANRNWNLHHECWTRKMFGRCALYLCFRQIETHQQFTPVDIHDNIHKEYEPPKMPTPLQAITEIERAKDAGEQLRIRQPAKKIGKYVLENITEDAFRKCKASYDSLKREGR